MRPIRRTIELTSICRVKALDRHNIGTVTSVDDSTGTARVAFTSARGATPWCGTTSPSPSCR